VFKFIQELVVLGGKSGGHRWWRGDLMSVWSLSALWSGSSNKRENVCPGKWDPNGKGSHLVQQFAARDAFPIFVIVCGIVHTVLLLVESIQLAPPSAPRLRPAEYDFDSHDFRCTTGFHVGGRTANRIRSASN
jgi:hypothetical protein